MRFIKLPLISIIVLSSIVFLLSLLLPSTAVIQRTGMIQAPVDSVYAHIANLREWKQWNFWTCADTTATWEFADSPARPGAWYSWKSEKCSGKLTLLDTYPNRDIRYQLQISNMRPVTGGIALKPATKTTTAVFWHMEINLGMLPWWKLRGFLTDRIYGPGLDNSLTKLRMICEHQDLLSNYIVP